MIRWLLWLLGGLLLGGIVHLATVLLLPLAATAPANSIVPLPSPTPDDAVLPFMDPAFATAVCRYDLAAGPLKLRVPVSQAYTSVSFYARTGVAYYAINDRAAGRSTIELDLMTSAQRAELPDGLGDDGLPVLLAGDIEPDEVRGRADLAGDGAAFVLGDVGDHHARALAHHQLGGILAQARGAAGDQRHLASQTIGHVLAPILASRWAM